MKSHCKKGPGGLDWSGVYELGLLEYEYHRVPFWAPAVLDSCLVKYCHQALNTAFNILYWHTHLSPKCVELIRRNATVVGLASSFGNIRDFSVGKATIRDQPARPCRARQVSIQRNNSGKELSDLQLLKYCTETLTTSRFGCIGTGNSTASSLAVGIHIVKRPFGTRVRTAKSRTSLCSASKP